MGIKVAFIDERFVLPVEDPKETVETDREKVLLGNFDVFDCGGDAFEFADRTAVFAGVQLIDGPVLLRHIEVLPKLRHSQFAHSQLRVIVQLQCQVGQRLASLAANVEYPHHVIGVGHSEPTVIFPKAAVHIVNGYFQVEVVIGDIAAPPSHDGVLVGVQEGESPLAHEGRFSLCVICGPAVKVGTAEFGESRDNVYSLIGFFFFEALGEDFAIVRQEIHPVVKDIVADYLHLRIAECLLQIVFDWLSLLVDTEDGDGL